VNGSSFTKELTDVDALEHSWIQTIELIQKVNPGLNIVFTISPVRHIKDGLVENNQSKAVLIELVRRLTAKKSVSYFPSYEIMMDELRDYRFYKKDLVHPSEEAIDYIWDNFQSCYFSSETITLNKTIERYRLAENHKSLYENSDDYIQFKSKVEKEKEVFLKEHNYLNW
jgi:PIN domain nuclease of toxin-antitoxin system